MFLKTKKGESILTGKGLNLNTTHLLIVLMAAENSVQISSLDGWNWPHGLLRTVLVQVL